MAVVYQCKNCGALLDRNSLVCWFCKIFIEKDDVVKGKIKNSKTSFHSKESDLYLKKERIETINFHTSNINSKGIKTGYVYLLKGGNYFKIGKTKSVTQRTKTLKIQLPFKCQLVHSIQTNNIDLLEAFWHKRFGDKRKNGEWFQLNKQDINEFIKKDTQIFE